MRLCIYSVIPDRVAPSLRHLLSAPERARLEQMLPAERPSYVAAHGVLRVELGRWLGCAPGDVPLTHTTDNPSTLEGAPGIAFALSRNASMALVAVGRCDMLGVDLESIDDALAIDLDMDAIAEVYLPPAVALLYREAAPDERLETFLRLWTRHEAFVKALGEGLLINQPDRPPHTLGLCVEALTVPSGYVGAVACSRELVPTARELEVSPWG